MTDEEIDMKRGFVFPERPVQVLEGLDNYGKPKQLFANRLAKMTDPQLFSQTEQDIWLSAYASNNQRSDYHWHAKACWAESERRDPGVRGIYKRAYENAKRSAGHD